MNEGIENKEKTGNDADKEDKLKKEMLKPITKAKDEEDKELQDLEVETTAGGKYGGGG
jgi:hypothetical protein